MVPTSTTKSNESQEATLHTERLTGDARVLFCLHSALNGTSEEFDQAVKILRAADGKVVSQLLNDAEKNARSELQTTPSTMGNIATIATISRQLERASALRNQLGIPELDESNPSPTGHGESPGTLAEYSVVTSKNNRLYSAIDLALEDRSHFDKALELLKLESRDIQAGILDNYEVEQTSVLGSLGDPTISNIVEYSQAIRNLEGISALRGQLRLPSTQLLSTTTAVEGEGLSIERKGVDKKELHQNYSLRESSVQHDFISHGVIPDRLRTIGVELPKVFSHVDEAIATGIDRALSEISPLKYESPKRATEILAQRVDNLTKAIDSHDDNPFRIGESITSLTCLLVTKLTQAEIIDPNELRRVFDRFRGISGEGAVLKIEAKWTDEDPLRSMPFSAAESIRNYVRLLNRYLRQAQDENWRDPNLS